MRRFSFPVLSLLLLVSSLLGSCAGTTFGNAVEQALGSSEASPSPTPRPTEVPIPLESSLPEPSPAPTESPNPDPEAQGESTPLTSPTALPTVSPSGSGAATSYSDLNQAPPALQSSLEAVAALGVLSLDEAGNTSQTFEPNRPVTRREFARWLVAAHNVLYQSRPSRQIRLAPTTETPLFQDLPTTAPDFPAIQGLAEGGFIPSTLTGATSAVQFKPNDTLNRETLVLWKVSVEHDRILPTASMEALQQAWGFQDAARISAPALGAILVDSQNGELANIRRVFGYTTLFQPQKLVTRAEAATALWYFGTQGQGVSAADVAR